MPPDVDFRFSPRPNRARDIAWRPWGDAAFAEARSSGKPILLSLSAVWCHWCHVMDETTYSNADVISTVNDGFVPVRVDNDRRPDINRRYNMGGWPSTGFLTAEGEVITGATYVPPHAMLDALARVSEFYAAHRAEMDARSGVREGAGEADQTQATDKTQAGRDPEADGTQAGRRTPASGLADIEPGAPDLTARQAAGAVEPGAVDWVVARVVEAFDPLHGGFGTEPKFPQTDALALLLLRAGSCRDERVDTVLQTTLARMAGGDIYDRIEDGFFRYATHRDWSEPHYEKMLEDNARLLRVYADAFGVYADDASARTAEGIARYVLHTLWQPGVQAFSGSQDADEAYYRKDAAGRHELETPFVDATVYADWNALAAAGLLRAAQVLRKPELSGPALAALETLWERGHGRHGMAHYLVATGPGRDAVTPGPVAGLLGDQALVTASMLDAYEYTGERTYLARAELLAGWVSKHLGAADGGFLDRSPTDDAQGLLAQAVPDPSHAAVMADDLLRLAAYTGDQRYRERAALALAALGGLYQELGLMASPFAAAALRYDGPHLHVVVVGASEAQATQALLQAALGVNAPLHTVQTLDPQADVERLIREGFATGGTPVAYVCLGTTCLPPTGDPAELIRLAAGLTKEGERA
jgi:uncharacterized protein